MRVNLEKPKDQQQETSLSIFITICSGSKRQYKASENSFLKTGHISKEEFDVARENFERNDKHLRASFREIETGFCFLWIRD